jgi:hypothetical protein
MIDSLTGIGKYCAMEKGADEEGLKQSEPQDSHPSTDYDNQKQVDNVEYFKYLGSMKANDPRCTAEIKSRIATAKAAFNRANHLFSSKLDVSLRKRVMQCQFRSTALCVLLKLGHCGK